MGYIWANTDKQDMDKSRCPVLEHAREQQIRIVEYGVDLANVHKAVNPGKQRPASGLNLFEGMCKQPQLRNQMVISKP